ncbi:MAG: insulinase family protein, partial [Planctomycetota bacterium]|nr:insulinase family protein [Planctomycetota bacterium]
YLAVLRKLQEIQIQKELWDVLEMHGATEINASTSFDYTEYHYSLPANRLEVWAWVERDRLKNPVFREFYTERDVILEEMRWTVFDSAWGRVYAELRAIAFIEHPYRRPIIGFRRDIRFADPEALYAHIKRYYVPRNAVAVVVGGVKPEEVFTLVQKYFGDIENPADVPPRLKAVEPEQNSERRSIIRAPFKKRLSIAFHRPESTHPDFAPLELLTLILSHGHSSRLYKTLVKEKKFATDVNCWNRDSKHPDLFIIRATPVSERSNAEVEAAIIAELERLKKEGVSDSELEKAKKKSLFGIASSIDTNGGIAYQLGYYQTVAGDWRFIHRMEENIRKVTKEDIKRVANRYFKVSNMSVVHMEEER